jgi:hypothetical protein
MLRQAGLVRLPETAEDLQDPDAMAPAATTTAKVRFIS